MKPLQKTKDILHKHAVSLNQTLESKGVKKIRKITIIIFAILLILDVIFVLPNKFPTFSKVVLDSSPRFMFIIWLWGIMTATIFFPRKVKNIVRIKFIGLILIIVISTGLFIAGNHIYQRSLALNCENFDAIEPPMFTEIVCYNTNNSKIDFRDPFNICSWAKFDLTTISKLSILLFGIVFGYFLWPQTELIQGDNKL